MIILDTNLVSEPLKPKPDAAVLAWLDRQAPETLYLTTITVAELQAGIETLPAGKRRRALQETTTELIAQFEGRVLSFDQDSAHAFGRVFGGAVRVRARAHRMRCAPLLLRARTRASKV